MTEALAQLGVTRSATWPEIKSAYRQALRAAHPDSGQSAGRDTPSVTRIVEAYGVLTAATAKGTKPLAAPTRPTARSVPRRLPAPTPRPGAPDAELVLPAGDVFSIMLDAAQSLGTVSFADRADGLVQVVLSTPNSVDSQLLISINEDQSPTRVSFALEPLARGNPPPIELVVERLAALLKHGETPRTLRERGRSTRA